jgi:PTS system cellobiose-specific IIB component
MEQKVILLACAAGMSTSLLVTKMQEVSKKDKIFAIPVSKVDQKVNEESIDVILIDPQIRYMEKRINGSKTHSCWCHTNGRLWSYGWD